MNANTKQAKQLLRQVTANLNNITRNATIVEMENLQVEMFLLQNAVNLLTKEVELAIITKDEAEAESYTYVETLEDIDNKVVHEI